MKHQSIYALVAAAALGLNVSAFAAGNAGGNGGGGSHGGGNAGAGNSGGQGVGSQHDAGSKGKSSQAESSAKADKAVARQLSENKALSAKLSGLLPAGTDLQAAAAGFKNLGQFVAAVHVSTNLGLSFADVKTRMMDGASLGSTIQALSPQTDATAEATKAQRQADRDLATRS